MARWSSLLWRGSLTVLVVGAAVMSAGLFSGVTGRNQQAAEPESLFGNYLAGRQARIKRDTDAAASYYEKALQKDPGNEVILEQTFLLEAAGANWERAAALGKTLIASERSHRIARVVLGVLAFKSGDLEQAERHFGKARKGPISDLTTSLARAWVSAAAGSKKGAFSILDGMKKAEWSLFYRHYHKGLIADFVNRLDLAADAYAQAFKKNKRTLRIAEAYARHAAEKGDIKGARKILRDHISSATAHPISTALLAELDEDKKPGLLVRDAAHGLAEVFYGIGDALTGEGGIEIGTIYLQLALHLRPDFPLALRSLGEVYDSSKHYEEAIGAYERVRDTSPLWMNIQVRKAYNLNSLKRTDDALALLERLAKARPEETHPLDAMGGILRSHKRYDEAAAVYSRAIALVEKPATKHWALFYARGVSYERLGQWPKAEADLKRALELKADQPLVLNYLGYSWVDQGQKLDEAMRLIKKAVELKPDDGYFVDSLGWAYYRLGKFDEATKHLERAVELRPDDPVINDHLGDAYWRVGRRLEARYQWSQALTLEPEPEDAEKIKLKLASGLEAVSEKKALAGEPGTAGEESGR